RRRPPSTRFPYTTALPIFLSRDGTHSKAHIPPEVRWHSIRHPRPSLLPLKEVYPYKKCKARFDRNKAYLHLPLIRLPVWFDPAKLQIHILLPPERSSLPLLTVAGLQQWPSSPWQKGQ